MIKFKQNSLVNIIVDKKVAYAKVWNGREEIIVEPFIHQPVEFFYDEHGYERVNLIGKERIQIRFSLSKIGDYQIDFFAGNGELLKTEMISIVRSNHQEKLTIIDGQGYYSNGKYFIPYGINMAYPEAYPDSNGCEFGLKKSTSFLGLKQYEKWMSDCAKNGINLVRIWCGCAYFSPDLEDVNKVNYAQFSKLDKIFEMANRYNIRLKLTFEKFRYLVSNKNEAGNCEGIAGGNIFNKYATDNGKIIEADEWLTQEKYRKIWLKKVREYKLRYACDPALFAVELWNEMNCFGAEYKHVNDWNVYMSDKVRELFPNTVILNSLGSLDSIFQLKDYNNFCFEKFDWIQVHSYLDQGAYYEELGESPIEAIKKTHSLIGKKQELCNRKVFIAETGAVNDCHYGPFRYYLNDDKGIILVDCVYTPFFLGCIGPGNIWHWDSRYVASKNLYKYYKPLAQLIKDVNFKEENFHALDLSNEKLYCFVLKGETSYLAFLRNKEYNWKNILRDDKKAISTSGIIDFSQIGAKNLSTVKIWSEEKCSLVLKENQLRISKLKYGILIKGNI